MRTLFTLLWVIPFFLNASFYTDGNTQLALNGYDVLTYYDDASPNPGLREYTTRYSSAQWRFISAENLEAFLRNPEQYVPQYDGWCAWAVANGNLSPSNPNFFIIQDDKLYMMCSESAISNWLEDPEGSLKRANANWPALKNRMKLRRR